ncbi:MAG: leucine-rich repeat domain-containing protein [Prevotella sp.]|nr:leucine-rich repeat domain-containing protein [Prevotella sp.]
MDLITFKDVGKDKNQIEYEILGSNTVRFHQRWDTKKGTSKRVPGKEDCSHYEGEIYIPETIVDKGIIYTVVEVGTRGEKKGAFFSALDVKHVSIPGTVSILFNSTFAYCHNLKSVTLREGLEEIEYQCFYDCSELNRIVIPDSVVSIENEAFMDCCDLAEATIGRNVYRLYNTFRGCRFLSKVTCRAINPPEIVGNVFEYDTFTQGELLVPYQSLQKYKNHPYWGLFRKINYYDSPSSPILPAQKTPKTPTLYSTTAEPKNKGDLIVYEHADNYDNQMEFEILNDNKVRFHPRTISYHWPNLPPDSDGNHSRYKGEVIIPEAVLDEKNHFYTVVELGTREGNNAFRSAQDVTGVSVPSTVRVLFTHTFAYSHNLHRIYLNEGLKEIGTSCFLECKNLHSIVIPDSVEMIGKNACKRCESLEDVTLGKNVKKLDSTFKSCNRLRKVTCRAITPPEIVGDVFEYETLTQGVLLVPPQSIEKYKNHPYWRQFSRISTY